MGDENVCHAPPSFDMITTKLARDPRFKSCCAQVLIFALCGMARVTRLSGTHYFGARKTPGKVQAKLLLPHEQLIALLVR